MLQRGGYLARVDVHISSGAQRSSSLAFEDWVALLVDREAAHRDSRRLTRPLAKAMSQTEKRPDKKMDLPRD